MVREMATIAHIARITFRCCEEQWCLAHGNFGGLYSRGFVGEWVAPSEVARFRLMGAAPVDSAQKVAQFGLMGEVRGREMRAAQSVGGKHRDHADDRRNHRDLANGTDGDALCIDAGGLSMREGGHHGCSWV